MAEDFVVCSTCLYQQSACICETAAAQTVEYLTPVEKTACQRCITCVRTEKAGRQDFCPNCSWCTAHPDMNEFDHWYQSRGVAHLLDPTRERSESYTGLACPNCGNEDYYVYEDMSGWVSYSWDTASRIKGREETAIADSAVTSFQCVSCDWEIAPMDDTWEALCNAYWDSEYY